MDSNKTFNISMPESLLNAIDKQAEVEFRNRSDLIREAVRAYILQKGGMSHADQLTDAEEKRIKDSLIFSNFSSTPTVSLSCAYRPQPNSVVDIFAVDSTAIKLMEQPPKLRDMGWDLDTLDRARPVAGEYLEVTNGKRKILRLYRDGQHTFTAGMDFFGHAVNKDVDQSMNFNLLSVAEFITNYVNFAQKIQEILEKKRGTCIFTIVVSNPDLAHKDKPNLALAAYDGIGTEKAGELSLGWVERSIIVRPDDNMTTERIAYLIYSEFCYFFGARSDELWYTKKNQEINKEVFLRAGR